MNPDRGYRTTNVPPDAKRVFEGVIFDAYQWDQELYDGSKAIFEKVVRADGAVVVPVLPDGRLLMIEDTQPHRGMIVTFPAGRVEEGEKPEEAARRELLEETGYEVNSLEFWYQDGPMEKIDWTIYAFIGRGAIKTKEPALDPGEKITLHPVTFDELVRITLERGSYRNRYECLILEALADPAKMQELKKRLFG